MAGLFGRKKKFAVEVQLVCPLCRETLGTEGEVDVEKDLAWCPFCKREMSFGDVADFSTVVSLEKQPLPEGLSLLPDAESLRTVVLKERNRFERGIILVLAVALLAFGGFLLYPVRFMLGGGIFLGFGVLLVGALIVEPDLELIIRFFRIIANAGDGPSSGVPSGFSSTMPIRRSGWANACCGSFRRIDSRRRLISTNGRRTSSSGI